MLDTFYQWLVSFLTIALGLVISLWAKVFERRSYRIAAGICTIFLGLGSYAELEHERRKAATDLEAAIQKTSVRVATRTAASVSDILGRQFADTVAELQSMKKVAAASATEVHAIWEDTQSGKQKRKTLINYLNARILQATGILDYGSSVGPPGSGGSPAQYFTEQALNWTTIVGAYLLGSLGQSYADRFHQARLASTPRTSLDPKSASRIEIQVRELEAKMDTLKQFVKELAAK